MFRTRRTGLVRRLWRSRLVPDPEDGGDRSSEGGPDDPSDSNPEKIPKTEYEPDSRLGLAESGGPGDGSEHGGGTVCVPRYEGRDGATVTCCWFKDRPRRDVQTGGRDRLSCHWDVETSRRRGGCGPSAIDRKARPLIEEELKRCTYGFLKKLKEKSLDVLLEAVESKGGVPGDCVTVPQTDLQIGGQTASPQYLLCRLFRWPDLPLTTQLKALCHCRSLQEPKAHTMCCNPYHYSRLCGADSPPPPYSRMSQTTGQDSLDTLHSALPHTDLEERRSSHSTSGGHSDGSVSPSSLAHPHWCNVAYWEHRTRVGRLYPVYDSSLNIFYDLPQGTGLCLGQLPPPARSGASGRTRAKIGHGILLSKEPDGVWAYNRSQHPVFVNSPTLEVPPTLEAPPRCRNPVVRRVMPGYSIKVFDYERSRHGCRRGDPAHPDGPFDPDSVRISFAKGWGACYSRQFITSCPCWLEILLNNHR
ncbi:mothers against decapentaplegic homolog 6a [Brachyhypopomus gauderio]|uniref:mothers against decapentaplegic homolog 6a n=1 Tax=Brachyhypopomus gauderio TaxID=698409 RepID=UPI004040F9C1